MTAKFILISNRTKNLFKPPKAAWGLVYTEMVKESDMNMFLVMRDAFRRKADYIYE